MYETREVYLTNSSRCGTKADNENRLFGIWAPAATAATGAI